MVLATRLGTFFLLAACALALAPAAGAQGVDQLFRDYQKNGSINGCNYSDGQLRRGAGQIPPDIEQYAPGFADQLNAARDQRAGGGCGANGPQGGGGGGAAGGGGSTGGGSGGSVGTDVGKPPGPRAAGRRDLAGLKAPSPSTAVADAALSSSGGGGGAPWFVWLLAGLVGLTAVGLGGTLAGRRFGWSAERFTRPLGGAAGEAGGRTSDFFAELFDRLRFRK